MRFPGLLTGEAFAQRVEPGMGLGAEEEDARGSSHGDLGLSLQGIKKGGEGVHETGGCLLVMDGLMTHGRSLLSMRARAGLIY